MRLGSFLLQRPVTGQGLGGESATADRLAARSAAGFEPREIRLCEPVSAGRAEDRSRPPRHPVEVGPVAPLLIRLVRHPYSQEVDRPRREVVREPLDLRRPELEDRPPPVADCRSRRERPLSGPGWLPRAAAPPRPRRYPEDP